MVTNDIIIALNDNEREVFEYHNSFLSSWHQHCAESPRQHHREVGETAVHSVKCEAFCAGGDVCMLA